MAASGCRRLLAQSLEPLALLSPWWNEHDEAMMLANTEQRLLNPQWVLCECGLLWMQGQGQDKRRKVSVA